MDMSRLSFGEMVAAASGVALFIIMFLPWYGVDIGIGTDSLSAWSAFDFIDLLLFLVAVAAVAIPLARAYRALPRNLPLPPAQIVAVAGAMATLLVLFRIVELPFGDEAVVEISRKVGVFLGLIASLGIAFGGFTAMREPAPRRAPRR